MKWTHFNLRKPLFFLLFYLILFIGGIFAIKGIRFSLNSGEYSSIISIKTQYFGMDSRYIEKNITIPIEKSLSSIKGVKKISSVSEEGQSIVTVRIAANRPIKIATMEIKSVVDTVKQGFPSDVQEPVISHYDPSQMPIFIVSFYPVKGSNLNLMDIRRLVSKKLKPNIQKVEGVAEVIVTGGKQKEIVVFGNTRALYSSGLQLQDLSRYIQQNNLNYFLGTWKRNGIEYPMYSHGQIQNLFDIEKISVNSFYSNESKYQAIGEIARVKNHYKHIDSISRINGSERVSLYIQKRSGANILRVCSLLNHEISDFQQEGVKHEIDFDSSKEIRKSLNNLVFSILLGIVILFMVAIPFLGNIKITLLALVPIPISIAVVFLIAVAFNIELSAMILTGIALGVGLLVDNGLIVLEFLSRKKERVGVNRQILRVTERLNAPLFSSLVTTLCVFFPILFSSIEIRFMYWGFIVVIAVLLTVSLFLATGFVPVLYRRFWKSLSMKKTGFSDFLLRLQYKLVTFQKKMFRHRRMSLELLVFLLVIAVIGAGIRGYEPASNPETKEIYAYVEPSAGTSLENTDIDTKKAEDVFLSDPRVKKVIVKVEKAHASVIVKLKRETPRSKIEKIMNDWKARIRKKTKTFVYFTTGGNGGKGSEEINIEFVGDQIPILKKISAMAAKSIYYFPEFSDVVFRYKGDEPVYSMIPDIEKLQMSGLTVKNIVDESRIFLYGVISTKMNSENKGLVDIRVTSDDEFNPDKSKVKRNIDNYLSLMIRTKKGVLLPIGEFLTKKRRDSSSKIYRINKRRVLTISARLKANKSLSQAFSRIKEALNKIKMPPGYYWQFDDRYAQMKKRNRDLGFALLTAIFLTLITLVVVYEDIGKAILTMISILFSLPGVVIAFYAFGFGFSTPVYIAMILLTGITVNTTVLLLDDLKKDDTAVKVAHKMKGKMSAILLTTLTTVSGLIPMLFTPGSGSYIWKPFSLTIIFGLLSSTLLSLVMTPILVRNSTQSESVK